MEIFTQRRRICWFRFLFWFCVCFCFRFFLRQLWPNRNILHNGKSALHINSITPFSTMNSVMWIIITSNCKKFKHLMERTGHRLPWKHLQLLSQVLALKELRQICSCLSPQGKFLVDMIKESSPGAMLQPPAPTSCVSHEDLSLTRWSSLSHVLLKPLTRSNLQLVNCCYWLHTAWLISICIL